MIKKVLFMIAASWLIFSCSSKEEDDTSKKIVFIDNVRLYNEFDLTKELQAKITEDFRVKKNSLDSLELEVLNHAKQLQMAKSNNPDEIHKFQLKKEEFLFRKQKLEEEQQQLTAQYNNQIVAQINQYIKEFGDKNGFDLIVGSNGEGNVMYGSAEMDVTNEALAFLNSKYNPAK